MRRLNTRQLMRVMGWTSRDTVMAREKSGFLPPAIRDVPNGQKYWIEAEILSLIAEQTERRSASPQEPQHA